MDNSSRRQTVVVISSRKPKPAACRALECGAWKRIPKFLKKLRETGLRVLLRWALGQGWKLKELKGYRKAARLSDP